MINDVVCCEMFNGSQNQFFTSTQDTTLYALCMHVSCVRLRIFRTFQESVRIAYYFHINRHLQRQL